MLVLRLIVCVPVNQEHTAGLSAFQKKQGAKLILSRICEAYGRMLLMQGLFQADCHPGNILVMKGTHGCTRPLR